MIEIISQIVNYPCINVPTERCYYVFTRALDFLVLIFKLLKYTCVYCTLFLTLISISFFRPSKMNQTESSGIESKCIQALHQNNLQAFNHYYTILDSKPSLILSYKLLYLLSHNKKEYYFLFEQVEHDNNIEFVIEVERNMELGNINRLKQLKNMHIEFAYLIELIINVKSNEVTKEEKVEDYIGDCVYILKNYNKI